MKHTKQNTFFFFVVLFGISIAAFRVVAPYISVIVVAFIVVTIFMPLYKFFLRIFQNREYMATTLSVISVILTIVIPLSILSYLTVFQFRNIVDKINEFSEEPDDTKEDNRKGFNEYVDETIIKINELIDEVPGVDYEITKDNIKENIEDNIAPALNFTLNRITEIGTSVPQILTKLLIFLYLISTLFPNYEKVIKYIKRLSPLDDDIDQMYITKVISMSQAMIKGTMVIAIVQGVLSGIVLHLMGVEFAIFLTFLMIFLSIVPLGAGLVNIPIGIFLILIGNYPQGIFILANHFLIITNVDNLLRPVFVPKNEALPPVLTLISVFGGLALFGFLGFIYGPVIMILFLSTLDVYKKYYREKISKMSQVTN
ncbi:MAG TPA: AI-2E family transporter [Candidatus Dojkabacteria bacterium]|jgi:predicted PurR-regulated permease PerM